MFKGTEWLFFDVGSTIMNEQIAYKHRMIDGSAKSVSLSSEKKCTEVMEKYSRFAHILVGNNPEYGYLLKNDREKLLDIKYRANSPQ